MVILIILLFEMRQWFSRNQIFRVLCNRIYWFTYVWNLLQHNKSKLKKFINPLHGFWFNLSKFQNKRQNRGLEKSGRQFEFSNLDGSHEVFPNMKNGVIG